ncbi:MAG: type II toxin-antitoxin system RelE/ParE family toxin [Clostridia bacterium]|nr:type II toxin-antitoxin system RelE/ParE family toxin [Clostridia bacterium]
MYEVIYLPTALRQLEEIVDYITFELNAPDAALDFIDAVEAAANSLSEMPYRHPVYRTRFAVLEEIRWLPVKRYNIYYKVFEREKVVEIRRVLHQLRDTDGPGRL